MDRDDVKTSLRIECR